MIILDLIRHRFVDVDIPENYTVESKLLDSVFVKEEFMINHCYYINHYQFRMGDALMAGIVVPADSSLFDYARKTEPQEPPKAGGSGDIL